MHSTSPALDLLTTLRGVGPRRATALLAHHDDALWARLQADPAATLTCPGGLPVSQLEPALAAWEQMGAGGDLLADASRLQRGVVDTAVLDVARGAKRIVCVGGLVWSVRAHAIEARVAVNLTRLLTDRVAMARRRRPRGDRCYAVAGAGETRVIAALAETAETVRQARGAVRADRARRTQPRGRDGGDDSDS